MDMIGTHYNESIKRDLWVYFYPTGICFDSFLQHEDTSHSLVFLIIIIFCSAVKFLINSNLLKMGLMDISIIQPWEDSLLVQVRMGKKTG